MRSEGTTSALIFLLLLVFPIALVGMVMGILAYIRDMPTVPNGPHPLQLYDDTLQRLRRPHDWHSIHYAHHNQLSANWAHRRGSAEIDCLVSGLYRLYFSAQVRLNTSWRDPPLSCQPCRSHYALRAILHQPGAEHSEEVLASRTYTSAGFLSFLSKEVLLNATRGDTLRIQIRSPCAALLLSPSPRPDEEEEEHHRHHHNSATLILSQL